MQDYFVNTGSYDGPTDENGLAQGEGMIVYTNGDKYNGQFMNGRKHGTGVMQFSEGSRFEGNYQNDFR